MAEIYGPRDTARRGGTVTLNFRAPDGRIVDERVVERDSAAAGISLRTGCFCNPGAGEAAFAIDSDALLGSAGQRVATVGDYLLMLGLPSGGAVRVSVGLASNLADVERFLRFAEETYRDRLPSCEGLTPRERC
jgi:selenocysteine lyase/cysteine desulfurase